MNALQWLLGHWGTLVIVLTTGWVGNTISSAIFQWAGAQTKTGPVWLLVRFLHGILNRIDPETDTKTLKKTLGTLLFAGAAVCLFLTMQSVTACRGWLPVGGTAAIGGAVATGGANATGGTSQATGGTSQAPATVAAPEFPACQGADTGGLEWSEPVRHPLGWKASPGAAKMRKVHAVFKALALSSVLWAPNDLYTLDQGELSGCVGFSWEGCLSTAPFVRHASDTEAKELYHQATIVDQWPQYTWPPDDTGSSVEAGAKAAQNLSLVTGATAAWSVPEVLQLLKKGPGVVGTDWLEGMFAADNCGHLNVSGKKAGGHAYEILGNDQKNHRFWFMQSWGKFGVASKNGRSGFFWMTEQEFGDLFNSSGEAYFPKLN